MVLVSLLEREGFHSYSLQDEGDVNVAAAAVDVTQTDSRDRCE